MDLIVMLLDNNTEEDRLRHLATGIDLAFTERDPFFQAFFRDRLLDMKWIRATILQGGSL